MIIIYSFVLVCSVFAYNSRGGGGGGRYVNAIAHNVHGDGGGRIAQ